MTVTINIFYSVSNRIFYNVGLFKYCGDLFLYFTLHFDLINCEECFPRCKVRETGRLCLKLQYLLQKHYSLSYICILLHFSHTLSINLHLSIYLSISIYMSIYLSIYLSISIYMSIYLSISVSISFCPCFYLYLYLSAYLFFNLSAFLSLIRLIPSILGTQPDNHLPLKIISLPSLYKTMKVTVSITLTVHKRVGMQITHISAEFMIIRTLSL